MMRSLVSDFRIACKRHKLLLALVLATLIVLFVRARFGAGVYDEPYYYTQVLRLIKGDRLFADIWDITQTQGIPLLPFYWIYTKLFGYDGLLLFGRDLMLLFNLLSGGVVYYALSTVLGKKCAVLITLPIVAFAPFSLLTVGYNNLHCTCMLTGVALAFIAVYRPPVPKAARSLLLLAGFLHALMFASYPASVIWAPVLCLLVLFLSRYVQKTWKAAWRCLLPYAIGMAVVAVGFAFYIVCFVGLNDALFGLSKMLNAPAIQYPAISLPDKLIIVFNSVWDTVGDYGLAAYAILTGLALHSVLRAPLRRAEDCIGRPLFTLAASLCICLGVLALGVFASRMDQRLALIVWIVFFTACAGLSDTSEPLLHAGITAWILYWTARLAFSPSVFAYMGYSVALALPLPLQLLSAGKRDAKTVWPSFILLALPSLLLTTAIMSFSSGFFNNARYGLFYAGLCVVALQSVALRNDASLIAGDKRWRAVPAILRFAGTVALPIVILIAALSIYCGYFYDDQTQGAKCQAVTCGPAKGIYTNAEKAAALSQTAIDLRAHAIPGGKLLVLENYPYAYGICSDMSSFATSTWVASTYSSSGYSWIHDYTWTGMFDYMEYRNAVPDVIFYYEPEKFGSVSDPNYSLHTFIQENYTCVLQREDYWIYHLRTTARKETK